MTVFVIETESKTAVDTIYRYEHLNHEHYVPFLDAVIKERRTHTYEGDDKNQTYIPFWGPLILTFMSSFTLLSVIILLCVLRFPHGILSKAIASRYYKARNYLSDMNIRGGVFDRDRSRSNKSAFDNDIFISYSRRDASDFVDELTDQLKLTELRIWRDELKIRTGLSLTDTINLGLITSRYAIVVFSSKYFESDWTKRELDILAKIQKKAGKLIIPIYYNVTPLKVDEVWPDLTDLVGLEFKNFEDTEALSQKIVELVNR